MKRRRMGVLALLGCGGLALLAGCGSGGGGAAAVDELLPFIGLRSFVIEGLTAGPLAGLRLSVTVNNPGVAAGGTVPSAIAVVLTSSDGRFADTIATVTVLSRNHLDGTVTDGQGVGYSFVVDFAADGQSVTVTITVVSTGGSSGGTGDVPAEDNNSAPTVSLAVTPGSLPAAGGSVHLNAQASDADSDALTAQCSYSSSAQPGNTVVTLQRTGNAFEADVVLPPNATAAEVTISFTIIVSDATSFGAATANVTVPAVERPTAPPI